jgi:hypothetical protein
MIFLAGVVGLDWVGLGWVGLHNIKGTLMSSVSQLARLCWIGSVVKGGFMQGRWKNCYGDGIIDEPSGQ